jgi:GT2 family glycosyltransferase
MSTCSIIIPLYNQAALTRQCIRMLLDMPAKHVETEIVAVDDGSSDGTARVLAEFGGRIRIVRHAINQGFARTCNDGAAAATGDYLVFLNNDTEPIAGWLDALVQYADAHPRAALVGCKLLFPNGMVQHAGIVFGNDYAPRHIYAGFPSDHPLVNKSRRFQAVTAACVLIRRSLFAEMGGFDTNYLNSYEDMDLSMRLADRGWEIHYCHTSALYHLESATRDSRSAQEARNSERFLSRWKHRIQADEMAHYIADGLLILHAPDRYPIKVVMSPLLGVLVNDPTQLTIEKLLKQRSEQVYDLLEENVRLRIQLQEAQLAAASNVPPLVAGLETAAAWEEMTTTDGNGSATRFE